LVEPASVHLGCLQCSIAQAGGSCISGYHLCTSLEILSGVFTLIRNIGWVSGNKRGEGI